MNSSLVGRFCFTLLLIGPPVYAQISSNVSLFGGLTPVPLRYSGSWGYTAVTGEEYALLGGNTGTHIITIDDSANIRQVAFIPGPSSNWREITVVGNYAFVVTEGSAAGTGMQVINLNFLPDSARLVTTYTATFTRGHIISRDIYSDSSYVYVSGTSTTGGVHIMNVSNPAIPVQTGIYDPVYYIHDAHIRGNRMYAAALNQGMDIVNISNKSNPTFITRITYPAQFTHSSWTTEDNKFLFVADETDGLPARIWNIEDPGNIREVSRYSGNLQSLVHNPYIRGMFAFISHNTEGLRVVDIADPHLPIETGFYDTWSGPSGGFNGLWSAYPYFPSGKIIGGDRSLGLLVWRYSGIRAGRIYGLVTDSLSGEPLDSVSLKIIGTNRTTETSPEGRYGIGELPGTYVLSVTAQNYQSKTISGITLSEGDSLWIPVQLTSLTTSVQVEEEQPGSIQLHQNYPNPFNPSTAISFDLPSASFTTLTIYTILGQEVASLAGEIMTGGHHTISWDASGYPGGLYLYRLISGGRATARKMLLIR